MERIGRMVMICCECCFLIRWCRPAVPGRGKCTGSYSRRRVGKTRDGCPGSSPCTPTHTHSTKFPFSVLTNYLSERQTSLNWHPSLMNMQIRNPLKSTHDLQNHCCLAYICILKLDWLMFYDAITCRTLISIFPWDFQRLLFLFCVQNVLFW